MKILVIDDEKVQAQDIVDALKSNGYDNVNAVHSPSEGISAVKENRPDLVIVDAVLPDVDGFETCRQIKMMVDENPPKVLLVTGKVEGVDYRKAMDHGVDEFAIKTQENKDILDIVKTLTS